MASLARSQYFPRLVRGGRPLSTACVRLSTTKPPSSTPPGSNSPNSKPAEKPKVHPVPPPAATSKSAQASQPVPPSPSQTVSSASAGQGANPKPTAPAPSESSSPSGSSPPGSSSGSSGGPPPPESDPTSFLKRYRVLFIGALTAVSVSLVAPNFFAYRAVQDARKKTAGVPPGGPPAIAGKDRTSPWTELSSRTGSSPAEETVQQQDKAESNDGSRSLLVSASSKPASDQPGAASAGRSQVSQVSQDTTITAVATTAAAPGPAAAADSSPVSVEEPESAPQARTSEEKSHGVMTEEELEQLAAQLKDELEASKTEALRNVDKALDNVIQVVGIAQGLYQAAEGHIKELTMETFRSIELSVKESLEDVAASTANIARLRQSLTECQGKVGEVFSNLPARVAVLDRAASEVQRQGNVAAANEASQKASDALKSLHMHAEHMAQAQADLAVMEEYQRQVQDRIARYKDHMSGLELAQMDVLQKAADKTAVDSDASPEQHQSVYDREVQTLLSYAQQRVNVMEQKLSSGQERQAQDVTALLLQQREEDTRVMQLKLDHLHQQMEREHAEELQARDVEARYRLEEELTLQMKRQAAAHTDHLQASLQSQARQLTDDWRLELDLELRAQAVHHNRAVEVLTAQVESARNVLLSSAKSIESNHVAHRLWQSCRSLSDGMHTSKECPLLRPFVDDVRAQAGSDPLIAAALQSIPASALDAHLHTEPVLRQRFETLQRSCQRVAMVPEGGQPGVWIYAMSYLRSLFVFPRRRSTLSMDSLDLSSMDTMDLLALCDEQLKQGDFEVAVRVLNQLRGQPRVLAQDWLDQARLLLETCQALDVILAQLVLGTTDASTV